MWGGMVPFASPPGYAYASDDIFTDSLADSGRELWPIITTQAMVVVSRALKGSHHTLTTFSTL